jgi:hypothetical protein
LSLGEAERLHETIALLVAEDELLASLNG